LLRWCLFLPCLGERINNLKRHGRRWALSDEFWAAPGVVVSRHDQPAPILLTLGSRVGLCGLPGGAEGIRTDGHRGRTEIKSNFSPLKAGESTHEAQVLARRERQPTIVVDNIKLHVHISLCRAQTRHTQAGGDGDEQLRLSGRAPTAVRQRDQVAGVRTVRWKFRLRRSRTSRQEMFWAP
jgi:hypothetical protein